jgi:DNA-binding transcriptional ArsR family regulator
MSIRGYLAIDATAIPMAAAGTTGLVASYIAWVLLGISLWFAFSFAMTWRLKRRILDLMGDGEIRTGLQIIHELDLDMQRAALYVVLDRLEREGLITSTTRPHREFGIPIRVYRITGWARPAA